MDVSVSALMVISGLLVELPGILPRRYKYLSLCVMWSMHSISISLRGSDPIHSDDSDGVFCNAVHKVVVLDNSRHPSEKRTTAKTIIRLRR